MEQKSELFCVRNNSNAFPTKPKRRRKATHETVQMLLSSETNAAFAFENLKWKMFFAKKKASIKNN